MPVRVILALCVTAFSALCGRSLADGARRRAEALRSIAEGLRRLRVRMTGMFEPVSGALAQSGCALFETVAETMGDGASAGEAWRNMLRKPARRGSPVEYLTDADRHALSQLFDALGQSGREEQEILLAAALQSIEALRTGAEAKLGEADRLYAKLGLLVGLMLALIVL